MRDRILTDCTRGLPRLWIAVLATGLGLGAAVEVAAQQPLGEPVVAIGSIDGAPWELLDNVRGIVATGEGIVVADGGSRELRAHPAAGGPPIWTFGREGEGPGEFRWIEWVVGYRADSLAVWDPLLRRVTIVGPEGTLGRTFTLEDGDDAGVGDTVVPATQRLHLATAATDGRFVARVGELSVAPGDMTAVRRTRLDYVVLDAEGSVERRLVTLPDDEQFVWAESGSRALQPRAFGRTTYVATRGADLVFATNDAFRISTIPLDGGTATTRDDARPALAVAAVDRRRWAAENAPSPELPAFVVDSRRKMIEAMDFPETFPPHGGLVVASDGSIWLAVYPHRPEADREWARFVPDGSIDRVVFPPGFRLEAVQGDTAWGVGVGAFDVEQVVAYRLPH